MATIHSRPALWPGAITLLDGTNPIDLLFTDLGLHDDLEAGLKLATSAVEKRPEIKVLYATGQAITDGMRAQFVPHSDVLPKPYTVDQILASLSSLGISSK
jgi:ActR/RegA family two-component response regulator